MSETNYTEAQKAALEKAYDLLGEHFDHCMITVNAEVCEDGESFDCCRFFWSGGYFSALGLISSALQGISEMRGTPKDVKPFE